MEVCLFEYVLLVIIGSNVQMVGTVLWGQINCRGGKFRFILSVQFLWFLVWYYPDPEKKLIDEIREAVLKNQPADSFTWTLLKLVYEADCCSSKKARVLSRYFSADEFQGAQKAIKALVTVPVEDSLIASPDAESLESFELKVVE